MQAPSSERLVNLYKPHKGQLPVHLSKVRFRVVVCGRRFGKTLLGCNEFVDFGCRYPGTLLVWAAPTYRQTKIAYRLIKTALNGFLSHSSDSELLIDLPNGARMMFCSAENYDALRGNGIHFLVLDECADIREKAWTEVLRPTLSDTRGRALFLGTPKGRNFFYVLFQRGLDPLETDWASFTRPTSANPYIAPDEIEAAKRELPSMVFEQEYLAVFHADSAGVFSGIDACIKGTLRDPDPKCDYVLGWDIAKYQDYSVISIINCQTMHLDYWQRTNQVDYSVQVNNVCSIAKRYNSARILQDSTGVGDPVLEQVQRRGLPADGYLFTNSSKKTLIESLVVSIQNVGITFPDIPVLITELRQMQYTLTPSRLISYSAPDGAHDDTVMSLALANLMASRPRGPMMWSTDDEDEARSLERAPSTGAPVSSIFEDIDDGEIIDMEVSDRW